MLFEHQDIKISGDLAPRALKLLERGIERLFTATANSQLLIIGTDHNLLSLHEREPYHLIGKKYAELGEMLSQVIGISEFMLFNTCNRIEVIALANNMESVENIIIRLLGFNQLRRQQFYLKKGHDAFSHFTMVTAGLFSQTPGENHIVSQVKDALKLAKENGYSGAFMQRWFDMTLHISKHIRNNVAPILRHVEIEELACNYLKCKLSDQSVGLTNALVIGTGEIGKVIIPHLKRLHLGEINWVYHQHKPENLDGVNIYSLADLPKLLRQVDLVICAASSQVPILHRAHAPFFNLEKPMHIVDLAIPRNVDHDLANVMENVSIIDLDDLKYWYRREGCDMNRVFEIANEDVYEHLDYYQKLTSGL